MKSIIFTEMIAYPEKTIVLCLSMHEVKKSLESPFCS